MFNPIQLLSNPIQLMGQLQNSGNPMGMMQQMFGNNPLFQRAMQMANGKNPEQLQQTVINLARQQGMNDQQLAQFLANFGLKI